MTSYYQSFKYKKFLYEWPWYKWSLILFQLGERVKDLLASFREQDNIQSEVQEVTKKLDRCQKRLDSQDREIDLQEQMEVNQVLAHNI